MLQSLGQLQRRRSSLKVSLLVPSPSPPLAMAQRQWRSLQAVLFGLAVFALLGARTSARPSEEVGLVLVRMPMRSENDAARLGGSASRPQCRSRRPHDLLIGLLRVLVSVGEVIRNVLQKAILQVHRKMRSWAGLKGGHFGVRVPRSRTCLTLFLLALMLGLMPLLLALYGHNSDEVLLNEVKRIGFA